MFGNNKQRKGLVKIFNHVLTLEEYLSSAHLDYQALSIDAYGNSGQYIVYPTKEEELSELLAFVNKHQLTVNIEGRGSKRGFGGLIDAADLLVSMQYFTGIVEHNSGDMTLTVKAGTNFAEIQRYLSAYNQQLALDPFIPQQSTIGGVIASNDSGPKRLSYGSARDAVIGLRVVYPDGKVIRTGGKVVKNVAGYDMNKLFIASMGTLGVITEVTVKLRPVAKDAATCIIALPDANQQQIHDFVKKVLNSHIEPICCELLDPIVVNRLTGEDTLALLVSFEDVEKSVNAQIDSLQSLLEGGMGLTVKRHIEHQQLWERLYRLTEEKNDHGEQKNRIFAVAKIGTKNLHVIDLLFKVWEIREQEKIILYCHGGVGHGLMQLYMEGEEQEIIKTLTQMRELAQQYSGYCIVKHLPLAQRLLFDVWGEVKGTQFLIEGIKMKIDPQTILNRKRYIGGI